MICLDTIWLNEANTLIFNEFSKILFYLNIDLGSFNKNKQNLHKEKYFNLFN